MNRLYKFVVLMLLLLLGGCTTLPRQDGLHRIAFGSCMKPDRPQPIWQAIIDSDPDLFLFIGDNIYADTLEPEVMRQRYQELAAQPGYQQLKQSCPVHAIWDDHDYGWNNAGASYPMRGQSEQLFLDFYDLPPDAEQRQHPGVYGAYRYGGYGRRVQVILLDLRYFRSPLKIAEPTEACPWVHAAADDSTQATLLGEAQWQWLEQQLRRPADLRLIISGIQLVPDEPCFEKWANFPRERERLFRLIRRTGAQGVMILSGDRHFAEMSRLDATVLGYPLYEFTSSGLNVAIRTTGLPNRYRLGTDYIRQENFGLIEVDWASADPRLSLQVRGVEGQLLQRQDFNLSTIYDAPEDLY